MQDLSDKELFLLLRRGNHTAFKVIYERYASTLIQFAFSKTGNRDDAKDCVQDVFVWLWQAGRDIQIAEGTRALEGYLKSAVKNKIINLVEKRLRQENYSKEALLNLVTEMPADINLSHQELTSLVQKEINAMPVKMRTIFELSRESGLSNKEIAGQLSLSEQTVKNQLGNAKQRLRIKLEHYLSVLLF
jgi:RNA polymerase sigma-70 factor (ECF subfamily)